MQAGADQQLATAAGGSAPSLVQRSSGGRGLAAGTPVGSKKPASTGHLRHWSWGSGSWGPGEGGSAQAQLGVCGCRHQLVCGIPADRTAM
jgi:hypothetical protein